MSAFDDLKSLIQTSADAANFTIWENWTESQADDSQRYIILKNNGGAADEDVQQLNFSVWFISSNDDDIRDFKTKSQAISKFLAKNKSSGCVFGVQTIASAGSPRQSLDNRWLVTSELRVLYSIYE